MGDEGIGVHAVRYLEQLDLPSHVHCLDGGTGGFTLLEPMQDADRVILIDAAKTSNPPGTIEVLYPKFSSDYPRTLTAHDIGLKDLLDAFYFIGERPNIVLVAVSINMPEEMTVELNPEMKDAIPRIVEKVRELLS